MEKKQDTLPSELQFVPQGTAPSCSLTGRDRFEFLFSGHPGQPEMFMATGHLGDSAPLHSHPWATWEVVLEGRFRFIVGDREFVATDGDFVYTPPNVPHTFVVESESARMVGFNHPSGTFEAMQRAAGPLFRAEGGPDMDAIARLADIHGVQLLGPPLTPKAT